MRLLLAFLLLAGCSGLRLDGECLYTREVRTTYQCEPGGTLEHLRTNPVQPD